MPLAPRIIVNPNGYDLQINNFNIKLSIPAKAGVVGLIKLGADLYTGTLPPGVFGTTFKEVKSAAVGLLINMVCRQHDSNVARRYLDFKIKMCHVGLGEDWRLPCLVTKHHNQLTWHAGSNRVLATGVAKPRQEQDLLVLFTDFDRDRGHTVVNRVDIANDQQLAELFGVEYREYDQHNNPTNSTNCDIFLEWAENPGPCLHYVDPDQRNFFDWQDHKQNTYVDQAVTVAQQMLAAPVIKYWSARPEQVYDSTNLFKLEYQGPGFSSNIPAELSGAMHHHYMFKSMGNANDMVLQVPVDRYVDIAELLLWLNTTDNVYLDKNFEFGFMLNAHAFNCKTISASNYQP